MYYKNNKKINWIIIFILFLLVNIFLNSCSIIGGYNRFVPEGDWELAKSDHFDIYYRLNSYAYENIEEIIQVQENAYHHILEQLDIEYNEVISIYIFSSPEDAGWDHVQGLAYNRQKIVLGVYSKEGKSIGVEGAACHEITHVITWHAIGKYGTIFLNEGIAVAMDGQWHNQAENFTDLHLWAKKFILEGKLSTLQELINNWSAKEGNITYPVSGSFVLYLLDHYGAEKFKKMLVEAHKNNFEQKCQDIYGLDFSNLEEQWRQFVLSCS